MRRRPACLTLLKALDLSSDTAWVALDLLKSPEFLSDTTARRSAVYQKDLTGKPKRGHISVGDQQATFLQVFEEDQQWDLPTIWKTRFLQMHIEGIS